MKAYVVRFVDDAWTAGWEDVPEPRPGPDEVVVEVEAAALAWSDVLQQEGGYVGRVPDPPFVSGHELAGHVVAAPSGADFSPGDRVFGFLPLPGAFAERVAVPARALRRTPDGLGSLDAAAITTSFLTADVALFTMGAATPGHTVVVHAGAGGVGRSAVQLARAHGIADVVATAGSAERRREAGELGAAATAGYDDFDGLVLARTRGRGADVVVESVGGEVFDRSAGVLAPGGRLVTIGASSGVAPRRLKLPMLWQRSASVCGLHIANLLADAPELLEPSWRRVLTLLERGHLDPGVGLVVAPTEIARGAEALRSRQVSGRVVVAPFGRM